MSGDLSERERIASAISGLAAGDALGAPASLHRTVRDPWVRQMLRSGAEQLDAAQVLRPVVPFVLTDPRAPAIAPTDDTESFALAVRLLTAAPDASPTERFAAWLAVAGEPGVWLSGAQRSAVLNAREGLLPPATGVDNPVYYDDSALPAAIACGLAIADPAVAAATARDYASMTHDDVGVDGAGVVAHLVSALVSGAGIADAIDDATRDLDEEGWLGVGIAEARHTATTASTAFSAIPDLIARFAPRTYSHPGTVTETLPAAIALLVLVDGEFERGLPLAMTIARHQDSLPAIVGALCGAYGGAALLPGLERLEGVTIPALAGVSLADLTDALVALRSLA
jgi:ADP-ribosylglycohydrolase